MNNLPLGLDWRKAVEFLCLSSNYCLDAHLHYANHRQSKITHMCHGLSLDLGQAELLYFRYREVDKLPYYIYSNL